MSDEVKRIQYHGMNYGKTLKTAMQIAKQINDWLNDGIRTFEIRVSATDRIEQLEKENDDLKSALGFYANRNNWEQGPAYAQNNYIVDSDLRIDDKGHYLHGGKRAQETLEKYALPVIIDEFPE